MQIKLTSLSVAQPP